MSEETVTSASGGRKGRKTARHGLIPADALRQVAEHYGKGAEKYTTETESGDHNWRRGYAWSLSYDALQRHANAFWGGETFDPETGSHHMAAVVFHALALITFTDEHPDYDDRYETTRPSLGDLIAGHPSPRWAWNDTAPKAVTQDDELEALRGRLVRVVRGPFRGDGSDMRLPKMGDTFVASLYGDRPGYDPDLNGGEFCVHYSCVEVVG